MAGMSRLAHAPARSSGTQAPSRKLKAERAWSSINASLITAGSVFSALPLRSLRLCVEKSLPDFMGTGVWEVFLQRRDAESAEISAEKTCGVALSDNCVRP